MDLREAYRVLELEPGASEDAVRDARKLLAKVWHPDRHANDPELAKKAQDKLADINTAFETIRAAKFPASLPSTKSAAPAPKQRPPTGPITPKRPPTGPQPVDTKADPVPPPPKAPPPSAPPKQPAPRDAKRPPKEDPDLLPRRRVRGWVILLLAAGLGVGAYFAIVKLGSQPATPPPKSIDAALVDSPDAATAEVRDAPLVEPPADAPVVTGPTFALGATKAEVRAAQGEPDDVTKVIDEEWSYGFSIVSFDKTGRVKGWWDRDHRLKTKLVPADPAVAAKARAAGTFGKGSAKDEVIELQGTPDHISTAFGEQWSYGGSDVEFDKLGKVKSWKQFDVELHAK